MKIVLLRHGQTAGSLLKQYVGSSDLPLCEEGRERAGTVPPRPDVKRVYTSNLVRTIETARILYPNAQIVECKGLAEMDFGHFELKSWRDMEHDGDYRVWVESGCEAPCPGGEDKATFTRRCVDAFMEAAAVEAAKNTKEMHCVVHSGTIMAVMSELAEPERSYFDWPTDFCGGYSVEYGCNCDEEARLLRLLEVIRPKKPLD